MAEPIPSAAVTLAAQTLAVPALTIAGVGLGLRPDLLLAGFGGALAGLSLLNTVPSTGDTARELVRTSLRRVGVAVGSAITAAYTAPLLGLINGLPDVVMQSVAFVAGVGAQRLLPVLIERLGLGQARMAPPPGRLEREDEDMPPRRGGWGGMRDGSDE